MTEQGQGGPPVSYTIEGLERIKKILGQDWKRVVQTISVAVGELVRNVLAVYPQKSGGVVWASERQRRWWWASRREAGLPPGYTRQSDPWSQRLGPSWTVRKQGDDSAVVGTRVTYAPYVQADAAAGGIRQQPMHHYTGWVTDKQAVDTVKASGDVDRIMHDAIEHALKDG